MDNDYVLNLDDILHTIETADVVRIRFLLLEKRLLIDNRYNEFEGPLIRLVNRSGSSEESSRTLNGMRPRSLRADKMTAIWCPKYVTPLTPSGVWAATVAPTSNSISTDANAQGNKRKSQRQTSSHM